MKIDIHNIRRRLSRAALTLQKADIPRADKDMIYDFENSLFADGLGNYRIAKYLASLKALYRLTSWSIERVSAKELTVILANIERSEWAAWTKHDYKLTLRKYLLFAGHKELSALIKLPKVHTSKLPEELLTLQDIQAILQLARTIQERAFIFTLWESGARIGELLGLQRKHVTFDDMGALLILDGKTGMRRVRLLESAALLDEWLSVGSVKPDSPVFSKTYTSYDKMLKTIAHRAGITKRIYPHLFRHSRATFLAGYLTEAQLCTFLGWNISSAMPRVYVHLNGHDLDAALARLPTLAGIKQPQYEPPTKQNGAIHKLTVR